MATRERIDAFNQTLRRAQGSSSNTSARVNGLQATAASRYNTMKFNRKAINEQSKNNAKQPSGWGAVLKNIMDSPVGKGLHYLDTGRSYVTSQVADSAEELMQGDAGGFAKSLINPGWENKDNRTAFWDHKGAGHYLEKGITKAGLQDNAFFDSNWFKLPVSITADVAFDPLVWAGGGVQGSAKSAAKSILSKGEKLGVAAGERAILKAAAEGLDETMQAAARVAAYETEITLSKGLAAQVAKSGKASMSGAQSATYFPKASRFAAKNATGLVLKAPFTGRVAKKFLGYKGEQKAIQILPKAFTNPLTRGLAVPRNLVSNSKIIGKLFEGMGGRTAGARALIMSGDPEAAARGLWTETANNMRGAMEANGIRLPSDTLMPNAVNAAGTGYARGKFAQEVYRDLVKNLDMDEPALQAARDAVEGAVAGDLLDTVKGAPELKQLLHELHRVATDAGIGIDELDFYFPRVVTDEARALYKLPRGKGMGGGSPTFTHGRTVLTPDGESNFTVRTFLDQIAVENGLPSFYKESVNETMYGYIRGLTSKVAERKALKFLEEKGIVLDASELKTLLEKSERVKAFGEKLGAWASDTLPGAKRNIAEYQKAQQLLHDKTLAFSEAQNISYTEAMDYVLWHLDNFGGFTDGGFRPWDPFGNRPDPSAPRGSAASRTPEEQAVRDEWLAGVRAKNRASRAARADEAAGKARADAEARSGRKTTQRHDPQRELGKGDDGVERGVWYGRGESFPEDAAVKEARDILRDVSNDPPEIIDAVSSDLGSFVEKIESQRASMPANVVPLDPIVASADEYHSMIFEMIFNHDPDSFDIIQAFERGGFIEPLPKEPNKFSTVEDIVAYAEWKYANGEAKLNEALAALTLEIALDPEGTFRKFSRAYVDFQDAYSAEQRQFLNQAIQDLETRLGSTPSAEQLLQNLNGPNAEQIAKYPNIVHEYEFQNLWEKIPPYERNVMVSELGLDVDADFTNFEPVINGESSSLEIAWNEDTRALVADIKEILESKANPDPALPPVGFANDSAPASPLPQILEYMGFDSPDAFNKYLENRDNVLSGASARMWDFYKKVDARANGFRTVAGWERYLKAFGETNVDAELFAKPREGSTYDGPVSWRNFGDKDLEFITSDKQYDKPYPEKASPEIQEEFTGIWSTISNAERVKVFEEIHMPKDFFPDGVATTNPDLHLLQLGSGSSAESILYWTQEVLKELRNPTSPAPNFLGPNPSNDDIAMAIGLRDYKEYTDAVGITGMASVDADVADEIWEKFQLFESRAHGYLTKGGYDMGVDPMVGYDYIDPMRKDPLTNFKPKSPGKRLPPEGSPNMFDASQERAFNRSRDEGISMDEATRSQVPDLPRDGYDFPAIQRRNQLAFDVANDTYIEYTRTSSAKWGSKEHVALLKARNKAYRELNGGLANQLTVEAAKTEYFDAIAAIPALQEAVRVAPADRLEMALLNLSVGKNRARTATRAFDDLTIQGLRVPVPSVKGDLSPTVVSAGLESESLPQVASGVNAYKADPGSAKSGVDNTSGDSGDGSGNTDGATASTMMLTERAIKDALKESTVATEWGELLGSNLLNPMLDDFQIAVYMKLRTRFMNGDLRLPTELFDNSQGVRKRLELLDGAPLYWGSKTVPYTEGLARLLASPKLDAKTGAAIESFVKLSSSVNTNNVYPGLDEMREGTMAAFALAAVLRDSSGMMRANNQMLAISSHKESAIALDKAVKEARTEEAKALKQGKLSLLSQQLEAGTITQLEYEMFVDDLNAKSKPDMTTEEQIAFQATRRVEYMSLRGAKKYIAGLVKSRDLSPADAYRIMKSRTFSEDIMPYATRSIFIPRRADLAQATNALMKPATTKTGLQFQGVDRTGGASQIFTYEQFAEESLRDNLAMLIDYESSSLDEQGLDYASLWLTDVKRYAKLEDLDTLLARNTPANGLKILRKQLESGVITNQDLLLLQSKYRSLNIEWDSIPGMDQNLRPQADHRKLVAQYQKMIKNYADIPKARQAYGEIQLRIDAANEAGVAVNMTEYQALAEAKDELDWLEQNSISFEDAQDGLHQQAIKATGSLIALYERVTGVTVSNIYAQMTGLQNFAVVASNWVPGPTSGSESVAEVAAAWARYTERISGLPPKEVRELIAENKRAVEAGEIDASDAFKRADIRAMRKMTRKQAKREYYRNVSPVLQSNGFVLSDDALAELDDTVGIFLEGSTANDVVDTMARLGQDAKDAQDLMNSTGSSPAFTTDSALNATPADRAYRLWLRDMNVRKALEDAWNAPSWTRQMKEELAMEQRKEFELSQGINPGDKNTSYFKRDGTWNAYATKIRNRTDGYVGKTSLLDQLVMRVTAELGEPNVDALMQRAGGFVPEEYSDNTRRLADQIMKGIDPTYREPSTFPESGVLMPERGGPTNSPTPSEERAAYFAENGRLTEEEYAALRQRNMESEQQNKNELYGTSGTPVNSGSTVSNVPLPTKPVRAPRSATGTPKAKPVAGTKPVVKKVTESTFPDRIAALALDHPQLVKDIEAIMADPAHWQGKKVGGNFKQSGKNAINDALVFYEGESLGDLVSDALDTGRGLDPDVVPSSASADLTLDNMAERMAAAILKDSGLEERIRKTLADPLMVELSPDGTEVLNKRGLKRVNNQIKGVENALPKKGSPKAKADADAKIDLPKVAKAPKASKVPVGDVEGMMYGIDVSTFDERIAAIAESDPRRFADVSSVWNKTNPKYMTAKGNISKRGVQHIENVLTAAEAGPMPATGARKAKAEAAKTARPATAEVKAPSQRGAASEWRNGFNDPATLKSRRAAVAEASKELLADFDSVLTNPVYKVKAGVNRKGRAELTKIYNEATGVGVFEGSQASDDVPHVPTTDPIAPAGGATSPVAAPTAPNGLPAPRSIPFEPATPNFGLGWNDATEVQRRLGMLTVRQQKGVMSVLGDEANWTTATATKPAVLKQSAKRILNKNWAKWTETVPETTVSANAGDMTVESVIATQREAANLDAVTPSKPLTSSGGRGGGKKPPAKPPTGGSGPLVPPPDPDDIVPPVDRLGGGENAQDLWLNNMEDAFAKMRGDAKDQARASNQLGHDAMASSMFAGTSARRLRAALANDDDLLALIRELREAYAAGDMPKGTPGGEFPRQGKVDPSIDDVLRDAEDFLKFRQEAIDAARKEQDAAMQAVLVLQSEGHLSNAIYTLSKYGDAEKDFERFKTASMPTATQQELADRIASGVYRELSSNPNLYAPRDVAEILNKVTKVNNSEGVSKFFTYYDSWVNWLKKWQVATPGFHVRNSMGGTFNNFIADVEIGSATRFHKAHALWEKGLLSNDEGQKMSQLMDYLGNGGQYSEIRMAGGTGYSAKPWSTQFAPIEASARAGQNVEFNLRGAIAWDRLLKGETIDTAIDDVVKYHFDYGNVSHRERQIKRVIPFYTWTRYNLPLQMEMFIQNPGKYGRYEIFKNNIEELSEEDKVVPGFLTQDMFGIRMPFNLGAGTAYVTPDLPFTQTIANTLPDFRDFNPTKLDSYVGLANNWASMMTPILKAPIEYKQNTQFFKGLPLPRDYKKGDLPYGFNNALGRAAGGFLGGDQKAAYFFEQMVPPYARARRLFPSEDKYQERRPSAIAGFMGLPIRTLSPTDIKNEKLRRQFAGMKKNSTR